MSWIMTLTKALAMPDASCRSDMRVLPMVSLAASMVGMAGAGVKSGSGSRQRRDLTSGGYWTRPNCSRLNLPFERTCERCREQKPPQPAERAEQPAAESAA